MEKSTQTDPARLQWYRDALMDTDDIEIHEMDHALHPARWTGVVRYRHGESNAAGDTVVTEIVTAPASGYIDADDNPVQDEVDMDGLKFDYA